MQYLGNEITVGEDGVFRVDYKGYELTADTLAELKNRMDLFKGTPCLYLETTHNGEFFLHRGVFSHFDKKWGYLMFYTAKQRNWQMTLAGNLYEETPEILAALQEFISLKADAKAMEEKALGIRKGLPYITTSQIAENE